MSILDISNWTTDEINNSIDTFKDTSLTDIGMVNCDIDSINVVGEVATATLWIDEDVGIDGYTGTAPLKIYKEDKVEIKLNSPLLEGDTIEVVDGKLCHVHRYNRKILDGSESWRSDGNLTKTARFLLYIRGFNAIVNLCRTICEKFYYIQNWSLDKEHIYIYNNTLFIFTDINKISTVDELKQWLSVNPTTVVYQLIEPYYEDITPYQSSIVLKTFNESSMIINTNLPIKANVSYRTNVPSISTLSNRVTEVSESDSVIQNLIDIIDDEVDE